MFSLAIDGSMYLLTGLNPEGYIARFATLIIGCAVLGFGIATEVAPNVLMVPGEGIVAAMSKVLKKELGTVKICFDCTLVSMALILSLIFFGKLNGVGIGTIISSVLIGMCINFYRRLAKAIWK